MEILRTVFVNTGDGFVQAVLRSVQLPFDEIKVSHKSSWDALLADREKKWADANRTHIQRPMELILVDGIQSKMLILHIFHVSTMPIVLELS